MKITVTTLVENYGLPKPVAQAVYSHYMEHSSTTGPLAGREYDWQKLAALLDRALNGPNSEEAITARRKANAEARAV